MHILYMNVNMPNHILDLKLSKNIKKKQLIQKLKKIQRSSLNLYINFNIL